MMGKPLEFWLALSAAMAYVLRRSEARGLFARMIEAGISGAIGYAVAADLAEWAGRSEILVVLVITPVAYGLLDLSTSLVSDREMIRQILIRRLGGAGK